MTTVCGADSQPSLQSYAYPWARQLFAMSLVSYWVVWQQWHVVCMPLSVGDDEVEGMDDT